MEIDEAFNFNEINTFSERIKKCTQDTVEKMEQKIKDNTATFGRKILES